eukprot:scaffold9088_cov118-Isochrysis_galbana.AAC.2
MVLSGYNVDAAVANVNGAFDFLICVKQNSAHAVERTMAPRQLFSQPMEDENDPEPGSKRVRPSTAPVSSK